MANQIGLFFAHLPEEAAAVQIADHLKKFRDPRMRAGVGFRRRPDGWPLGIGRVCGGNCVGDATA
jgi:hypothetical protein